MRDKILQWMTLTGWKGYLSLLLAGGLTALTLAPFYFWPLLIPGYGLLYVQWLHAPSSGSAFRRGWWWGFGFFLAGLYWVVIALTIDMVRFGWMIPFALIGLNGALAIFYGCAGWLFARFFQRKAGRDTMTLLWFTAVLFITEYMRSTLFTGFPWNLIGYSWGASNWSAQAASLVGVYGLTLITPLLAAACIVPLWDKRRRIIFPVLSLCMVSALCIYGFLRLENSSLTDSGKVVRVVQGNIPQHLKWQESHMVAALERYTELSHLPADKPVDMIVWPETAMPFTVLPDSGWEKRLADLLKPGQLLVTGAVTVEETGHKRELYNSLLAISADGTVQRYHKRHLVPFGEYVPLRNMLPIDKVTSGIIDFSKGKVDNVIEIPGSGISFRALICYEVIFPKYSAGAAADWLLNITNDAWYGQSSGPYQHLDMARFRAIEQGKPIIRAANTGVSAVFDPYGRRIKTIPLNEEGIIDISLPSPLRQGTIYGRIARAGFD